MPASDVATFDDDLQRLIDDMIETMYAAPGVGLAATQVGVPLRLFVVDVSAGSRSEGLIVMINPQFVMRDGMQLEEEGCLSVPGFNATVVRPARVRSRGSIGTARNRRSREPTLLARAFQHEMDHLDGMVFVDRLRGIKRDMIVRQDPEAETHRKMVTSPALRIVYFGTPAFAVPTLQRLLASRHAVAPVVSQPDRPKGRGQHFVHTADQGSRARARNPCSAAGASAGRGLPRAVARPASRTSAW